MAPRVLQEKLHFVLVVNGIDRLVVELKLPPTDAYHKLRHCIEEINETLEKLYDNIGTEVDSRTYFSPLKGNVLFSSSLFRMMFTLESYAVLYSDVYNVQLDAKQFAQCLWGDLYFNQDAWIGNRRGCSRKRACCLAALGQVSRELQSRGAERRREV